jgi:DNA-directed RNA polymerase specialized sigma24 family protein
VLIDRDWADEFTAAELLVAAQAGDDDAFWAPRRTAAGRVARALLPNAGSVHDAEDAVQETLDRAWRKLESFEDPPI